MSHCHKIETAISVRNLAEVRTCDEEMSDEEAEGKLDDDSYLDGSAGEMSRQDKSLGSIENGKSSKTLSCLRFMILIVLVLIGAMTATSLY